jgi:hypothetical protein
MKKMETKERSNLFSLLDVIVAYGTLSLCAVVG